MLKCANYVAPTLEMKHEKPVSIHDEGKIDIHNRGEKYASAVTHFEADQSIIADNRRLILAFLRDCALGKTLRNRGRKKIGPGRCLKYLGILKYLSKEFGKPFDAVMQDDMEKFVENLEGDRLMSKKGRAFSEATKADIKKTIRKFWKWKDGNARTYPDLVEWIDTSERVKEVPALTKAEIERMIEGTGSLRDKAVIMVLFDSGARAEEILNVRLKKEHVFWKEEVGCYMIRLEYSKTKPRTISMPLSTRHLRGWLEAHPVGQEPKAQLFPVSYGALKMIVCRLGQRVLKKRVTPHMLRHSSATFYANRLKNPYKLCYRYGWTMSSKMVDRYLDREGILEEETPGVVRADEIGRANRQSEMLREEVVLLREAQSDLAARHQEVSEDLTAIKSGKGIMGILADLVRQQREMAQVLKELSGRDFDVILDESSLR